MGAYIRILAIVVLAVFFLSILAGPMSAAFSGNGSPTKTPIKHVVEIMMENHSFDNLFGAYPSIYSNSSNQIINSIQKPDNLVPGYLKNLTPVPVGNFSTKNPVEGYSAYHLDWNNGLMNGFYNNAGPQSMTYFTAAQMAPEWDLAEQFGLGDMYFGSYMSESAPNRLFSLAGYTPVMNDYGPPPYIPFSQSIFSELGSNNIPWGYYIQNSSMNAGVINYFHGMGSYRNDVKSWSSFFSELNNNTLPSVSFMMPVAGGSQGYSQHPTDSVLMGEMWMLYVVNSIMKSPEWNSTAIFITYDENGGYYDHVAPPKVNGQQLGIRVPLIVVSPYAKEGYVSNTILNHASILSFIDYNWNLPALNSFVAKSNLPLDFFNFNKPYNTGNVLRNPVIFNQSGGFPVPSSVPFSFGPYYSIRNLSSLFPMVPQIPFKELPYSRTGSSNENLSSLGTSLYVTSNTVYIPFYETKYFIGVLIAVPVGLLLLGYRRIMKK